jgi:acylphosphatase
MSTIHLHITGKVQGVFYRATAKKIAHKLKVTGWIKNTKEGNVEAIATGNHDQLQEFIKWCDQGPESAKVKNVVVIQELEMQFDDFEIVK